MLLRPFNSASLRLQGPQIDGRQPCLSLFALRFQGGAVYEFSVYHLMRFDDPETEFPATLVPLGESS